MKAENVRVVTVVRSQSIVAKRSRVDGAVLIILRLPKAAKINAKLQRCTTVTVEHPINILQIFYFF
jgi:hypothetical protein